jgi:hypothetical protein
MEEDNTMTEHDGGSADVRTLVRGAIEEFLQLQQTRKEPAYRAELSEERKRREQLERRVNELIEENRRSRKTAEEAERGSAIRSELQRLGVNKVDLAFRAIKDDIVRAEDGRMLARTDEGELPMREYLTRFVSENPELLPGRIAGGSGASSGHTQPVTPTPTGVDLDAIRPGMSAEDLEKVRQEIARIARQTIRGK